jgi:hypothetical protein
MVTGAHRRYTHARSAAVRFNMTLIAPRAYERASALQHFEFYVNVGRASGASSRLCQ